MQDGQGGTDKAEAKVTSTRQGCDSNPTFRFSVIPSPTDVPQPGRFCSFVPEIRTCRPKLPRLRSHALLCEALSFPIPRTPSAVSTAPGLLSPPLPSSHQVYRVLQASP